MGPITSRAWDGRGVASRPANYYRREMRRQDARQRAALASVIEQLTAARERLQRALRQLDQGKLV